jgi:biotin carboxyl carrier protein
VNDFVVSIAGRKKNVRVINEGSIQIDGHTLGVELSKVNDYSYLLRIGNRVYDITTQKMNAEKYRFFLNGRSYETTVRTSLQEKAVELLGQKAKLSHHDEICAPMPGLILKLYKSVDDQVEIGEPVIILEAMKMENEIRSPSSGIIKEINVQVGDSVEKGVSLIKIE